MTRRRTTWITLGLIVLSVASGLGCSDRLETGYEPRRLGASDAERRAFYSPRYTRAAAQAEQERDRDTDLRSRRSDYRPGF